MLVFLSFSLDWCLWYACGLASNIDVVSSYHAINPSAWARNVWQAHRMSALKDTLGVSLQMQRFFCLSFLSAERNDSLNLHSQANLWVCLPKILKSCILLLLGLETTVIDFTGMKRVKIFNISPFHSFQWIWKWMWGNFGQKQHNCPTSRFQVNCEKGYCWRDSKQMLQVTVWYIKHAVK